MKTVIEYVIAYKDGEEFITENKQEADKHFKKSIKNDVHQYYRKTWVGIDGDYEEDDVEVYFNQIIGA